MTDRPYDLVLQGATGFTGRLVAAHLLERVGVDGPLRWALAGRNRLKLQEVRAQLGRETGVETRELPLLVGDAADPGFVSNVAQRSRVICSTVGPYAKYGSELVAACARAGTHYCDLTGEPHWMRRMIDLHDSQARKTGARIVHAAGFDSIPSDLGVYFLQREMRRRHGVPARRISARVARFRGAFSGGTIASMMNMMEEAGRDPSIGALLADPYALNPEHEPVGPDGPDELLPVYDDDFEQWSAPFVMAPVNTRVVRRTAALLGDSYGEAFRYDEAMLTGSGAQGLARAGAVAAGSLGAGLMRFDALRSLAGRFLPDPGEGPDKSTREAGYYDIRFHGEHPYDVGKSLQAAVHGDMDPGYGSTSRMLGEAALCLAQDELETAAGVTTPAAALGDALLARLPIHAGVTFRIEEV